MKTKKLPVSIVIPCADDTRIKHCLNSIDEDVEVVVVLNGATKETKEITNKYPDIKKVTIPERNLAKALNIGIEYSKYPKVLFMDSDCIFKKGTIRKIFRGLRVAYLSKGKVIFRKNNFMSAIIAKAREYTTSDKPNAYKPPLAIRKPVKKYINNYYFDSDVHWTEDADLDARVSKAGLKINYEPSAEIYHPPITLYQDLRSAFRYGIGKRIRAEKGMTRGLGSFFGNILDAILKKGLFVGIYLFIWSWAYTFGYGYQIIFDPYKIRK